MGYNARNDEIRDNIVRMQRDWQAPIFDEYSRDNHVSHHSFPFRRWLPITPYVRFGS